MSLIITVCKYTLLYWRFLIMANKAMNTAKSIGIGMITGATAIAVSSAVMKKKQHKNMKHLKKSAGKAVHTVGEMISGVENMLK